MESFRHQAQVLGLSEAVHFDEQDRAGMRSIDSLPSKGAPAHSELRWLDRSVPKVPVDVAASGPKVIRMAARLADRVRIPRAM